MIVIEVVPYNGASYRLSLSKSLKGRIIVERDYIVTINYEGVKQ